MITETTRKFHMAKRERLATSMVCSQVVLVTGAIHLTFMGQNWRDGQKWIGQEQSMKKYLMPLAAVVALGIATPAVAYDTGSLISMQAAVDVANDVGLVSVSHTQFEGDKWFIQGRDRSGRYMEMAVDTNTGDVLWVNR